LTYGQAVIGLRTAHSFLPEFEIFLENELVKENKARFTVEEFSKKLSDFFMARWDESDKPSGAPDMVFIVAGYDENEPYGKVFVVGVPSKPTPEPRNPGLTNFGMTWGGQLHLASRLIHGYDPGLLRHVKETLELPDEQIKKLSDALRQKLEFPIPYQVLPLQDCINLAIWLIRSTMIFQNLAVIQRGVGGPIDVAVIRRPGALHFVQKKEIRGET
jgi:hypothetical protein